MSKFLKLFFVVFAVSASAACFAMEGPYWLNDAANKAWQEDQSQMRGAHYASTFAADTAIGNLDCTKLPETVEKTTAYRTIWVPTEFVKGYQKKCSELQQLRRANQIANEAKALAEKVAKAQAAKKAARKAHHHHRAYPCRCQ